MRTVQQGGYCLDTLCAGIGELAALENLSSDTFVFTDNGKQWAVARYGTVRALHDSRALSSRTDLCTSMP